MPAARRSCGPTITGHVLGSLVIQGEAVVPLDAQDSRPDDQRRPPLVGRRDDPQLRRWASVAIVSRSVGVGRSAAFWTLMPRQVVVLAPFSAHDSSLL
jgi:hypothetical protein